MRCSRLTVTITHTAGVIALGLLTLLASAYSGQNDYSAPTAGVGVMVLAIGFTLFRKRLAAALGLTGLTHVNGVTHCIHQRVSISIRTTTRGSRHDGMDQTCSCT